MTAQEAKMQIDSIPQKIWEQLSPCDNEAIGIAIEALEKQIPKKPITYTGTNRADCRVCGNTVRGIKEPFGNYCSKCGRKLDFKGCENGV